MKIREIPNLLFGGRKLNKFYVVHRDKSTNLIIKANVYTQWTQDVLIKRLHDFNEQHKDQFAKLVDYKDLFGLIDLLESERKRVKQQLTYEDIEQAIEYVTDAINAATDKMEELRENLGSFKKGKNENLGN